MPKRLLIIPGGGIHREFNLSCALELSGELPSRHGRIAPAASSDQERLAISAPALAEFFVVLVQLADFLGGGITPSLEGFPGAVVCNCCF